MFGHSRTEILNCLSDVVLKVDDPSDFTVSGLSLRNYIGGIICTGDKNNPVLIQKTVYITDRYNGTVYDENNSLASHFEIYDSEGMPASKLATGESIPPERRSRPLPLEPTGIPPAPLKLPAET